MDFTAAAPKSFEGFVITYLILSILTVGLTVLLHDLFVFAVREFKIAFNIRTKIRVVIKENVTNYCFNTNDYPGYIYGSTDLTIIIRKDVLVKGRIRVIGSIVGDTVNIINNGVIDLSVEPKAKPVNTSNNHIYS